MSLGVERSEALSRLLGAVRDALSARSVPGTPASGAAEQVLEALSRGTGEPGSLGGAEAPPAYRHLDAALERARGAPEVTALAEALGALEPELAWVRRAGSEAPGAVFHDGHANSIIVGPAGLERRRDVLIGVSLVAPGVRYVDHWHPPEEVYVVMSGGEWYREGDGWHSPGVGGIVYNPPNVVHAMRAGAEALLAVWLLPTG